MLNQIHKSISKMNASAASVVVSVQVVVSVVNDHDLSKPKMRTILA
ncbi:hypothetical protein [Lactobacillus sp. Sy-1]|nr:hypothetical protein [Lactobacillus sp. Sy-1]MBW1605865.1 hypothetical protein [Lactobacillus sp. Sy-1]